MAEQQEPQEGDTKTEDGVPYTLRGGRWIEDDQPGENW